MGKFRIHVFQIVTTAASPSLPSVPFLSPKRISNILRQIARIMARFPRRFSMDIYRGPACANSTSQPARWQAANLSINIALSKIHITLTVFRRYAAQT
jgi:hypothetical protein